jgi:hypothetical protein
MKDHDFAHIHPKLAVRLCAGGKFDMQRFLHVRVVVRSSHRRSFHTLDPPIRSRRKLDDSIPARRKTAAVDPDDAKMVAPDPNYEKENRSGGARCS